MSKGIRNACKKTQNTLYRQFIKHRTKEAKLKYKKYKTKLISIMRICKKDYYTNCYIGINIILKEFGI